MNFEIKFERQSLEEFEKKLRTVEKRAPDRIINKLDSEGRKLRNAMKKNTPVISGNLKKKYKLTPVEKVAGGYEKGLYNKAPHHHLVNNGHRKVTPGGRCIGWTNGLFYIEKTMVEEEGNIEGRLRDWLDELFQELR